MNDQGKNEKRGIMSFLKRLDRAAAPLLVPILAAQLLYFVPEFFDRKNPLREEILGGKLSSVVVAVMLVPLFYFIFKCNTVYDDDMEKRFWETPSTVKIGEKLAFIFRQRSFYIEYAVIALVYLILPLGWSNMAFVKLFVGDGGFARKLIIKLVFLLAVFVIDILARLSAFNVWRRDKIEHPDKKRTEAEMERQYAIYIGSLMFISGFVSMMLPDLLPFAKIFTVFITPTTFIVLGVLIAALFIFRIVRAVVKRARFYGELSSLCKNYGFGISPIKKPVLSIFTMTEGESFNVTANGKKYSCKLIGATSKNDPLAIYDNGTCTYIHPVRFLKVTWMHYIRSYAYGYEADADETKVLIVNPVAKELLTGKGGRNVPIDNGDGVGEYKVFAGTAFINALRRDSVDKRV